MKQIMENHILRAESENESQIRRYFDQEKEYINSGHKKFSINLYKDKSGTLQNFVQTEENGFQTFDQGPVADEAQSSGQSVNEIQGVIDDTSEVIDDLIDGALDVATNPVAGAAKVAGGIVKGVKKLAKRKLETRESRAAELNILDFKNDSKEREEFYKSDADMIGDMWEEDAIILEGSLKHLQIIQDSLSDKLPKIIHFEIFYSTKIFVQQDLANALLEEWKQNKDIMVSNETQRQKRRKLENDVEKFDHALEIISGMTKMIKVIQKQENPIQLHHNDQSGDYEEDMDGKHLLLKKHSSFSAPIDDSTWTHVAK